MPQYRRVHQSGGTYFFTLVTYKRQSILTLPENIQRLRTAFQREKQTSPFVMDAIVILPDHLHAIWTLPEGDAEFSKRWSRIKRYFSIGCVGIDKSPNPSRKRKREKPVWQRRFWEHAIRDDRDWQRHMDYIHYNPVKHGLVVASKDWPHSSFQRCVERGWYELDWGLVEPKGIGEMDLE